MKSYIKDGIENDHLGIINQLKGVGYEVILSVGILKENEIGSNCGQHIENFLKQNTTLKNAYNYEILSNENSDSN